MLLSVIKGEKRHTPRKKKQITQEPKRVNLLVDIQAKLQEGKGAGYARWARSFNLKQLAQTMNYLTDHGLLEYAALADKVAAAAARHNELSAQIKAAEKNGQDRYFADPYHQLFQNPRGLCGLPQGRVFQKFFGGA